jgi:Multidrug resistance efflux pump
LKDDQEVKKGDVLFEIDPEPYELAARVARANRDAVAGEILNVERDIAAQKANVLAAQAVLAQAETARTQAEDSLRRVEPLLAKNYATADSVEKARNARNTAVAAVNAAQALVFILSQRETMLTRALAITSLLILVIASVLVYAVALLAWNVAWLRVSLLALVFSWAFPYADNRAARDSPRAARDLFAFAYAFDTVPFPNDCSINSDGFGRSSVCFTSLHFSPSGCSERRQPWRSSAPRCGGLSLPPN